MPIGKLCVLNALSTSDIPDTHLPAKDNFILISVISTQLAGIICANNFFFSAVLKCSLVAYVAFC